MPCLVGNASFELEKKWSKNKGHKKKKSIEWRLGGKPHKQNPTKPTGALPGRELFITRLQHQRKNPPAGLRATWLGQTPTQGRLRAYPVGTPSINKPTSCLRALAGSGSPKEFNQFFPTRFPRISDFPRSRHSQNFAPPWER